MNPFIQFLQPYPFEKLDKLLSGITPSSQYSPISLSIGEPKHPIPGFLLEEIQRHGQQFSSYPSIRGMIELREACGTWLTKRFHLPQGSLNPERHVLPVAGTREGIFSLAQCVINRQKKPVVVMPNPFYQIYEGAALLAGAEPYFMNTTPQNHFLPDPDSIPKEIWRRTQLLYLCSPGNPTGTVIPQDRLRRFLELADHYDFIIAADECYSEIYYQENLPPESLLIAAVAMEHTQFERCIVLHSLSKRSNAPGMRSGFVAGDPTVMGQFAHYRTYHGCSLPIPIQQASIRAWQDEDYVRENRVLYREKFAQVIPILQTVVDLKTPEAGFCLWMPVPGQDTDFTKGLYERFNVKVLPGRYLSRPSTLEECNPGEGYVRIALVAPLEACVEAAKRIRQFLANTPA